MTTTPANRLGLLAGALLVLSGCGDSDGDAPPTYSVAGTVNDFQTGEPLENATLLVDGLVPQPTVSTTGSSFLIEGVPGHSVFQVLAGSPPDYRNTYNAALEVLEDDQTGVVLTAISETQFQAWATAFGVDNPPNALLVQAVDPNGDPLAGFTAAGIRDEWGLRGPVHAG